MRYAKGWQDCQLGLKCFEPNNVLVNRVPRLDHPPHSPKSGTSVQRIVQVSCYRGEGLGLDCSQQNLFVQAFIWHTSLCFLSPQQREITMSASTYFTGPIEQRLSDDLHLAGVAERTRKGYLRAVRQLAEHAKCSPDKIDEEQLRQWLLHLKVDKQFAYGSLRVAFQASSSSSLAPVNETGKRSPTPNSRTSSRCPKCSPSTKSIG